MMAKKPSSRAAVRPASLDAVNFLLADVRGALGPYLNVFLITQQHWSQSAVGLVTTLDGLLGLILQTPTGAAIDSTRTAPGRESANRNRRPVESDGLDLQASAAPRVERGAINTGIPR
jgi:hypothetical protein